ncbi:MAG: L-histidine N(alpha)-methyltransferase [Ignavibacteria bacterium]
MHGIFKYDGITVSSKDHNERLEIFFVYNNGFKKTFAEDVRVGLLAENKFLLPKYFYDSDGSDYFEKICETPDYYLTRTEASILKRHCGEMAELNSDKNILVELGSGASIKTKFILNALLLNYGTLKYIPIDVSDILIESSKKLIAVYEKLFITGIVAEYDDGLALLDGINSNPKLFIFLGSTIGNFDSNEAVSFLKLISSTMNKSDSLLIGFDLKKPHNILNAAYNDKEGYTAKFNLNLLSRINTELNADFDLNNFKHVAYYNESQNRVEMYLESLKNQEVKINKITETVKFREGERIHTENSYKFTDEMIEELASSANLKVSKTWKDEKHYFALCMFILNK